MASTAWPMLRSSSTSRAGRPAIHETRLIDNLRGLLIPKLVFTEVKLGKGADAVVEAVEWNGTLCAAKRLHDLLLEDETPGGVEKLIKNLEVECLTWSKLRHPGVVQLFGVYLEPRSRSLLVPTPVMEIMDTNLRKYVEEHSKENFSLQQKTFVLRQVTQALTYLHSQNPPLVHHDFSPNNVLLNVASLVAKVSDFGMSRIINPSVLTRKSSIKGTLAFMAPEALRPVPKYDMSLDVFSFGNVVIYTLTHEWPDPEAPNKDEGDQLIALSELERREHCIKSFTAQERRLFLQIVEDCLANRPEKRPSSAKLMHKLKQIESSLLKGDNTVAPFEQLRQQLSAKEEECRQKDEMIKKKNAELQRLQSEKEKGDRTIIELKKQLVRKAETGPKPQLKPKPKQTLPLSTKAQTVALKTEAAIVRERATPAMSSTSDGILFTTAGVCACMLVHVCTVYTCVYACVCVCAYTCVCVHARAYIYMHVCISAHCSKAIYRTKFKDGVSKNRTSYSQEASSPTGLS